MNFEHLAVNSRGEIIVEEARRPSIRVFNSEGVYVNDIGGVGQGPGEYRVHLGSGCRAGGFGVCMGGLH